MKISAYIYPLLALSLMTGCSKETQVWSVGDADNAILLKAGIAEGADRSVATKAGSEDSHSDHLAFSGGTRMALQVSGRWSGHDPETVVSTTVGTVGTASLKHNAVSVDPDIYWDDFGTADPANASTGRSEGLSIYGVAVNGVSTAPVVDDFTALEWTLAADQSAGWSASDLLVSNNVRPYGADGCYKFDQKGDGKLLEFRHQMSRITFRLIANDGFETAAAVGATTRKFAEVPQVVLTSNVGTSTSADEWAFRSGSINVTDGSVSAQGDRSKVTMRTMSTTDADYTVIKDALVVPGSCFGTADTDIIARINADGNIYYVSAEKIRAKMLSLGGSTSYRTEAGKNYVITVILNKTRIDVTATVLDWTDIVAEEVEPVIDVNADYGEGGAPAQFSAFSFYRSTALDSGYSNGNPANANGFFAAESTVSKPSVDGDEWSFSPVLYWPSHDIHYQMRGVWPLTETATDAASSPRVETSVHDSKEYQVIRVANTMYQQGTFPSDLMVARPDVAEDAECSNPDHDHKNLFSDGVCATEGTVKLEFAYMMSKVEVVLSTTEGSDKVNLAGAKVEVTNIFTSGEIKIGDRAAFTSGSTSDYQLSPVAGSAERRLDAVVPQTLTYTGAQVESNVRFRITIFNTDGTKDIYYADVAPIRKSGSSDKVAPNGRWERGVHYIYNLKLSKTQIDAVATITDWVKAEADEEIWF